MSWDLYVQDWGNINRLSEVTDEFEPKSIGKRDDLIKKIIEAESLVDFSDPSWGRLDTEEFTLEFNMGDSEELTSFAMHVRGNELAIPVIGSILYKLNLKAADGEDDYFFDIEKSKENMSSWIEYKNQVLNRK